VLADPGSAALAHLRGGGCAVQQDFALSNLADKGAQQGGFARAVGADDGGVFWAGKSSASMESRVLPLTAT
jgi:hypothetical protein